MGLQKRAIPKMDIHERRRAPRHPTRREVEIRLCGSGTSGTCVSAAICEISIKGLGLLVDQPLERGERFLIRVRGNGSESKTLRYGVVRCQKSRDGQYRIGAEFLGPLGRA